MVAVTSFYGLTLAADYLVTEMAERAALAALNGFAIGLMFIAGHDACHGSLTRSRRVNAMLGRVLLLPSLHPYTAWVYSHNGLHHSWTNLKGRDPAYAPLSLDEYRHLSIPRQLLERLERSVLGVGLLYLRTIWWRHEVAPQTTERCLLPAKGPYSADRVLVIMYATVEILGAALNAMGGAPLLTFARDLFWAVLVPFLVWNWIMGFVTFQHHTHPEIPWFNTTEEWVAARTQVLATTHVQFPEWLDWLLLRIMNHTAHHLDPSIPLYQLRDCQEALADSARSFRWSIKACLAVFAACKLYDFRRHRWLDFSGRPLSTTTRSS